MDRESFASATASLGLTLSEAQLDAFEAFEEALYKANEVMNLTRVPRDEAWTRHFLDSLLFQDLIPTESLVLDIGSGPGFPAWPLACARPDLSIMSLDSNGKMLGFLRSQPLPNLVVTQGRAEEAGLSETFDVVTGRALAPLTIQLELSATPARRGGAIMPMRSSSDRDAIEDSDAKVRVLGLDLEAVMERALPGTDVIRLFPVYRKSARTPQRFPRRWSEIKTKPL